MNILQTVLGTMSHRIYISLMIVLLVATSSQSKSTFKEDEGLIDLLREVDDSIKSLLGQEAQAFNTEKDEPSTKAEKELTDLDFDDEAENRDQPPKPEKEAPDLDTADDNDKETADNNGWDVLKLLNQLLSAKDDH